MVSVPAPFALYIQYWEVITSEFTTGEVSSVIELWEAGEPSVMSAPLVGALRPCQLEALDQLEFVPAPDQTEEEEPPEETSGARPRQNAAAIEANRWRVDMTNRYRNLPALGKRQFALFQKEKC
jgi:hypothetical protein